MDNKEFHEKPYDAGTLAKLQIFELYAQEWIPVFLARAETSFSQVHIFDFFSGPGTDAKGSHGSPLRILNQLRLYQKKDLAGWKKVRIVAHLFDADSEKVDSLKSTLSAGKWEIPGVEIDCRQLAFQDALVENEKLLRDSRVAKLLIIDQFGVDEVTDEVFSRLIDYPTADFIFFLSSSTLHRFRDHPAIKQKIDVIEDSYDVHRVAVDYYRKLVPASNELYLGSFSIRKRSNIYGLIFGSHHPLGIHKFLRVAWATDEIAGEANFDIERENIRPGESVFDFDIMRPNKIRNFESELEAALRAGKMQSELDVVRFCIEAGMTCKHCEAILKKLKQEGVIKIDFRVPDVSRSKLPRSIRLIE